MTRRSTERLLHEREDFLPFGLTLAIVLIVSAVRHCRWSAATLPATTPPFTFAGAGGSGSMTI